MVQAKSLEGANLVWQRVNKFTLAVANSSPVERAAFLRSLKLWLATQKGNPKLQFCTFTNPTASAQVNPEVSTGGATIFALYAKKQNTATDAYLKVNDSATTAGGANGANVKITLPFLEANDEIGCIFQPGLVFATGIIVNSETTAAGGASSSSGDGPNGFFIIG